MSEEHNTVKPIKWDTMQVGHLCKWDMNRGTASVLIKIYWGLPIKWDKAMWDTYVCGTVSQPVTAVVLPI